MNPAVLKRLSSYVGAYGGGIDSASFSRRALQHFFPGSNSGKTELTEPESQLLENRSYHSYRNQPLASAMGKNASLGSIGLGLTLNPSPNAKLLGLTPKQADELEDAIVTEFGFASKTFDSERQLTFGQLQYLAMLTALVSGNCFASVYMDRNQGDIYETKIALIDPGRVCSPNNMDTINIVKGVEFDSDGAPSYYHILNQHPSEVFFGTMIQKWEKYRVFDSFGRRTFLHLFHKDRIGMLRGNSAFSGILEPLKQMDRYSDAELMAAVLSAMVTFFEEDIDSNQYENKNLPGQKKDPNTNLETFDISSGTYVKVPQGKKVTPYTPTRPNDSFDPFFVGFARHLSSAIGMPLSEVLLHYEGSYSSARADIIKAGNFYLFKGNEVVQMFCQPAYSAWFDEAVAQGSLPHIKNYGDPRRRLAYQMAEWIPQERSAIDETKSVEASNMKIRSGLSSIQRECIKQTGVPMKTIIAEMKAAKEAYSQAGLDFPFDFQSDLSHPKQFKEEDIVDETV